MPAGVPLWKMLSIPLPEIEARARALVDVLRDELGLNASVVTAESFIGRRKRAGSADSDDGRDAFQPPFPPAHGSEAAWARALRMGDPPVVARVQGGAVLFDLRTVAEREETSLLDAISRACHD